MVLRKTPEAGVTGPSSTLHDLIQASPDLHGATRIVVGFSGGLDSTVLLHLLHDALSRGTLTGNLHVLHVDHAMQPEAQHWAEHCRQVCDALRLPFESLRVPVVPVAGESLEESARNARHAVFASRLAAGEVLALAQHRDDQVETVLFRLLRGSGPRGLAGMPANRVCGAGRLVRPLLEARRAQLLSFAQARNLRWIEDGSNANPRFDRNFLRTTVLPLLHERWPGLAGSVARTAQLSGEAADMLDELALIDLRTAAGPAPAQLDASALRTLGTARQRNALRHWLQTFCAQRALAAPTYEVLARILPEVLDAAPDAEPVLAWGTGDRAVELRRHRSLLHVFAALPPTPEPITWDTHHALALPAPLGVLDLRAVTGKGLARERLAGLRVSFRHGGELVKPAGRPTRPLKKILQDAGVPPWLRDRIPLLYAGTDLVAVADLLICDGWLADSAQEACRVVWQHPDLDCGYPPHLLI